MPLRPRILTKEDPLVRGEAKDPFTGYPFLPGERVVLCPDCKTFHTVASWEANGNHCSIFGCAGHSEIGSGVVASARISTASTGRLDSRILGLGLLLIGLAVGVVLAVFALPFIQSPRDSADEIAASQAMTVTAQAANVQKNVTSMAPTSVAKPTKLAPTQSVIIFEPSPTIEPSDPIETASIFEPSPTAIPPPFFIDSFDNGTRIEWRPIAGNWSASEGTYLQHETNVAAAKTMLRLVDRECYTYELNARTLAGSEGFLVIFKFQRKFIWWSIGGWQNTFSMVEGISSQDQTRTDDVVPTNEWHRIKIVVNREQAGGWLNDVERWTIVRPSDQVYGLPNDGQRGTGLDGFVGIGTWNTRAQFDDVRITLDC